MVWPGSRSKPWLTVNSKTPSLTSIHDDMINLKLDPPTLRQGDCLDLFKGISDGSIDMVMTDPPYGTTACKWDAVVPFEPMWKELERVVKPNGAIVMTAIQPFTSALIMSNIGRFKYCWVWEKQQGTNPLHAKKQPLKSHEDVCVWYKKAPSYTPQMMKGTPYRGFATKAGATNGEVVGGKSQHRDNPTGERYPKTVQRFSTGRIRGGHPTQKPVALMEYLIKTYTHEGEVVLDFAMGSGTTGVAAKQTRRNFIGFELDEDYFRIATKRISSPLTTHHH